MKPVKLLIVAALATEAQQPAKVHRIAWLGLASPSPDVLRSMDGFRQALSGFRTSKPPRPSVSRSPNRSSSARTR